MRYLLDTSLISELVKPKPAHAVVEWVATCDEPSLYLSVLTLGELQKGVTKLSDSKKKRRLQLWIQDDLRQRFGGRVLDIDEATAITWGRLQGEAERRGRPMPVIDSLIAATAVTHELIVVTRNGTDIEQSGATVFDPWSLPRPSNE